MCNAKFTATSALAAYEDALDFHDRSRLFKRGCCEITPLTQAQLKNTNSLKKGSTVSFADDDQEVLEPAQEKEPTKPLKTTEKTETLTFLDDKSRKKMVKSASVSIQDTCPFVISPKHFSEQEGYADMLSKDHRMKTFFDLELRKRDELLELHLQMPGMFRELLFTDEEDETMLKLQNLVQTVHRYNETTQEAMMDFKFIGDYSRIVKTRIDDCFGELRKEVSITEKQEAEYKPRASEIRNCNAFCATTNCPTERW
ncbi:unnamed protein product [Ceutorhynchus assimilis]|uniref:Uncharacterized protein n=1 Tax=Ceutorhynchus assimilis TaxID=467358 RepID=A0A9N9QK47_9CUCU|nr:unnamed protein product [Ceutorhynchus assimilis]